MTRTTALHGSYPLSVLQAAETLIVGQADDLKFDLGDVRVWLSRCTVEDGEPYDNKVTIEVIRAGRWVTWKTYQAR